MQYPYPTIKVGKYEESVIGRAISDIRLTRGTGYCYKPSNMPWRIELDNGHTIVYTGYGRSLTTKRGHKYKCYAYGPDGKPVKSRNLSVLWS